MADSKQYDLRPPAACKTHTSMTLGDGYLWCSHCGAIKKGDGWDKATVMFYRPPQNDDRFLAQLEAVVEPVTFQHQVLAWAVDTFGPVAKHPIERAARLVEEAIEVAQAMRLPKAVIHMIVERVFSRPVGDLAQEIGGVALTLDALAQNAGINVIAESNREFDRVRSKSKEHFARKHAEKVADGTADLPEAAA